MCLQVRAVGLRCAAPWRCLFFILSQRHPEYGCVECGPKERRQRASRSLHIEAASSSFLASADKAPRPLELSRQAGKGLTFNFPQRQAEWIEADRLANNSQSTPPPADAAEQSGGPPCQISRLTITVAHCRSPGRHQPGCRTRSFYDLCPAMDPAWTIPQALMHCPGRLDTHPTRWV